jgi:hypothetical protein
MGARARARKSSTTAASPLRLFSYVVARDYGFAPNPFHGYCTLATCKPKIRKAASPGDWILGTGSAEHRRAGYAVYVMRVDEVLSFNEYLNDARFARKRPDLRGSRKTAFGDNIYSRRSDGAWVQLDSHHSLADGSPNQRNIVNDTQVDKVLVSERFVYWGGEGPAVPDVLRSFGPNSVDVCCGRGHRSTSITAAHAEAVVSWIETIGVWGICGRPDQWP